MVAEDEMLDDLARVTSIAVAVEGSYSFGEGRAHLVSERVEIALRLVRDPMLRAQVKASLSGCRERRATSSGSNANP
jgi:hypothetical protein